jgi:hypothetical protein
MYDTLEFLMQCHFILIGIFISLISPMNAVTSPGKHREFGGLDTGDDQAALLNPGFKTLTQIVQDDVFREFEFRQYIFACQAKVCT